LARTGKNATIQAQTSTTTGCDSQMSKSGAIARTGVTCTITA